MKDLAVQGGFGWLSVLDGDERAGAVEPRRGMIPMIGPVSAYNMPLMHFPEPFRQVSMDILERLSAVAGKRKTADPENSYIADLHHRGLACILRKLGEEAIEVILAAGHTQAAQRRTQVVHESADLVFHLLVMLAHLDISWHEVKAELESREGLSGLVEKAHRAD